ncbi:hypothetical protein QTP88_007479 [Uroleucon formosanum]
MFGIQVIRLHTHQVTHTLTTLESICSCTSGANGNDLVGQLQHPVPRTDRINCYQPMIRVIEPWNSVANDIERSRPDISQNTIVHSNCQMPTKSVNRTRSSDIDVELNTDYTYENETEMSIEIITNDFDEGIIPQMTIDSGINTDLTPRKSLLYNVTKRYKQRNLVLSQHYASAKKYILKAEK